jgi:4-diphosphocytidyl-2-C-methyl-D-erythritol kinase
VLAVIAALAGCRLARMSGSGSACFGLFADGEAAATAAEQVAAVQPSWWVRAGTLGHSGAKPTEARSAAPTAILSTQGRSAGTVG